MGKSRAALPEKFAHWFAQRDWEVRPHQLALLEAFKAGQSSLLIAPTGTGKTLAGFLPSLIAIDAHPPEGLHTLYISPLKALTNDIGRNLMSPVNDLGLNVRIESRTGDTPAHKRARQRAKPPHILLTTPESLMLMLSHPDAQEMFKHLACVVVDEAHSFAHTKRGDFTALALAHLKSLSPGSVSFGLSATAAEPSNLAEWLGGTGTPAHIICMENTHKPDIRILKAEKTLPFAGFTARYAAPDIYREIKQARTTIVFVNTRAQAELMLQMLWEINEDNLAITLYHGSLAKERRRKTEETMAQGKLRAVIATSALELGIDWGDVDRIIQIGAPKSVSRLLQRIGRSNHRLDAVSNALLVPTNRFEVLECRAAMQAIAQDKLDSETFYSGALDVVVQFIVNAACSAPVKSDALHALVTKAMPYRSLERSLFDALFGFAHNGGYVLGNYERFHRLRETSNGFIIASPAAAQRHRQNIGVIVEATRLKVKKLNRAGRGIDLGDVEEHFAQQLTPGDTFVFAGQILEFIGIKDMVLQARASMAKEPKLPSYSGGQMPLSTFLSEGVRRVLSNRGNWCTLPAEVQEWLAVQEHFSSIPKPDTLLVEHFRRHKRYYLMIYTFEGRKVNQTLGLLVTRRMERLKLKPLSFSVTDYTLAISGLRKVTSQDMDYLLHPEIMDDDLEEWINDSSLMKRAFRTVAVITGLSERRLPGQNKTMKQITFSTDLIYDVLRRHEPDHILLKITRQDAERDALDAHRLSDFLIRYQGSIRLRTLDRASPMAIPLIMDMQRLLVHGEATEELLQQLDKQTEAEQMMEEIRAAL
jgi:ATP-dependent helicase Lhr and Lhr-like helicase